MHTRPTILLVDDNPHIRSFIKPALEDNGFNCIEAANGEEAVHQVEESIPDLIVLDIELGDPDMDGLDTCKRIRSLGFNMPVIFLTVRTAVEDLERCFEVATPNVDYQKKLEELRRLQEEGRLAGNGPDIRELIARIKFKLPVIQQLGPHLRIARGQRKVEHLMAGRWVEVDLQPLQYEVFKKLVDEDGRIVGTFDLLDRVFHGGSHDLRNLGESVVDYDREKVHVCIANIRRKIDPQEEHHYIKTVPTIGYRFCTPGGI